MGVIKVTVSDEAEQAFRETAMDTFGHKKGSLSKAAERALQEWSDRHQIETMDDPVGRIRGMLSHVDKDGVDLQEEIGHAVEG